MKKKLQKNSQWSLVSSKQQADDEGTLPLLLLQLGFKGMLPLNLDAAGSHHD